MGQPGCDLPSDKRSVGLYCGGINIFAMYESLFCIMCGFVVGFIPLATFYYEGDDVTGGKNRLRFFTALCYEAIVLFAFILILFPLYFVSDQISSTNIPVVSYHYSITNLTMQSYTIRSDQSPLQFIPLSLPHSDFITINSTNEFISYQVDFPVYVIGLAGWVGWFAFCIFVGVGLCSLPFDLILAYIYRPVVLSADEFAKQELQLQTRTNDLIDIAVLLKKEHQDLVNGNVSYRERRKRMLTDRIEVNKLTQMVYVLERDKDELMACKNILKEYNPLKPYFKLIVGCFYGLVSLLWIIHIFIFLLVKPRASIFLNEFLISFDTFFPMFGNIFYGLLSLYLLFCTINGCFKIGLRFLCIKIHPMEVNKTYMNSFLFNAAIILTCTIPVVHFCTIALGDYTVYSDAYLLFGVKIANLHFFSRFYNNNVFIYAIIISALMTLLYLLWRPKDKSASTEEFKTQLERRGAKGYSAIPGSAIELTTKSKTAKL